MVKIRRCNCPQILRRQELLASYYNHPEVTNALSDMQFGKCAYCETMIENNSQVDHYIPCEEYIVGNIGGKKQYSWQQANRWSNLIHACPKCNGAKKKEKPIVNGRRVIINPTYSRIDPENHIDFKVVDKNQATIRVTVIPKNHSQLGDSTITKLKLDTRKDHLGPITILALEFENLFLKLLVQIKTQRNIYHVECQRIIRKINEHMLSNSPYAGFARAFFRKRLIEFENTERKDIESEIDQNIDLMINVPSGIHI